MNCLRSEARVPFCRRGSRDSRRLDSRDRRPERRARSGALASSAVRPMCAAGPLIGPDGHSGLTGREVDNWPTPALRHRKQPFGALPCALRGCDLPGRAAWGERPSLTKLRTLKWPESEIDYREIRVQASSECAAIHLRSARIRAGRKTNDRSSRPGKRDWDVAGGPDCPAAAGRREPADTADRPGLRSRLRHGLRPKRRAGGGPYAHRRTCGGTYTHHCPRGDPCAHRSAGGGPGVRARN